MRECHCPLRSSARPLLAAFAPFACCLIVSHAIYIRPAPLLRKATHFLFPFLPLAVCLIQSTAPSFRDAVSCYPNISLLRYGAVRFPSLPHPFFGDSELSRIIECWPAVTSVGFWDISVRLVGRLFVCGCLSHSESVISRPFPVRSCMS